MKQVLLTLTIATLLSVNVDAKKKKNNSQATPVPAVQQAVPAKPAPPTPPTTPAVNNANEVMVFTGGDEHNFGNVPEGPQVTYEFEFINKGKEPITLTNAQASCGCTTPSWTKEPVAPKKKGTIKVTYNTQGRPGPINKQVTITSNVGTKVIKITGNVEKAPDGPVPSGSNPMIKH